MAKASAIRWHFLDHADRVRVRLYQTAGKHDHGLAGQAQLVHCFVRVGTAFQRRIEEVGAQAALDVDTGPDAQHVQRDELGRLTQRPDTLGRERAGYHHLDRAEIFFSGADGDDGAGQRKFAGSEVERLNAHHFLAMVDLPEHPALGQRSSLLFEDAALKDRLDSGPIRFILSVGESHSPGAAVFDRQWSVAMAFARARKSPDGMPPRPPAGRWARRPRQHGPRSATDGPVER
ncbi:hypothetical protein ACWCQP_47110 [Streptomyces chartreusis]